MENSLPPINQRIKKIIDDYFSGNISQFSEALGYTSPQKVNRLFKLDSRDAQNPKFPTPSTEMLIDISNKFDITLDELVKGHKPIFNDHAHGIPYYENDVTGSIVGSFADIREEPAYYVDFKPFNDCTAYFAVYGDSMYPRFASGEIVAVKEVKNRNTIQWGEAHLVITDETENNMRTVKTIHPNDADSNSIILRASHPSYKGDIVVKKESVIGLYIVKGKIRRDQM